MLDLLQHGIIVLPLFHDLSGHAVKAIRGIISAGQEQIRDGSSDSSVAVIEGVYDDEPKIRECRFYNGIQALIGIEPSEKGFHFSLYVDGWNRHVVDALFTHCTRYNLHFFGSIATDVYFIHPAIPRWKQGRMPTE